jgi:hypothetical protein
MQDAKVSVTDNKILDFEVQKEKLKGIVILCNPVVKS